MTGPELAFHMWCDDAPPLPASLTEAELDAIWDKLADFDRGACTEAELLEMPESVKAIALIEAA